jgi:hypothetical protein
MGFSKALLDGIENGEASFGNLKPKPHSDGWRHVLEAQQWK